MSYADIVEGTYVAIQVEDPDAPGSFLNVCGLTAHTYTAQVNTRDRFRRNCDEPGSTPVRSTANTGKQWDLSGSGLYNRSQSELVEGLLGKVANYRFFIGEPADDAVYSSYRQGKGKLTQLQITGGDENDVEVQLTITSEDEWTTVQVP